jgi:hypothetical protein
MDRWGYEQRGVKPEAIVGLVIGIVVSYILQCRLPVTSDIFGCIGSFFSATEVIRGLIVVACGGLWYSFRNVV